MRSNRLFGASMIALLAMGFMTCRTSPATVSLHVEVRASGTATPTVADLGCDPAAGSGWLADASVAARACAAVRAQANRTRLVKGSPKDRACTMIYGGSQIARVTGFIGRGHVAATITRADGCGIADWQSLVALLGPPP